MQGLLTNKVAIITGASRERGIGLATARLFAEHGATVVITDLAIEDPLRAAAGLGSGHLGLVCDVTDLAAFVVAQTATLGHIDGEGHCQTQ